ncbi:MAG: OsmC family protein [Lentimicrobium sp.]|mgnify:CR=1 FL=1|nr:OsmC family protein [Lentimicrobium sp.]
MDTTATLEYLGDLQLRATHTRSGQEFVTDAPVDNNGKGSAFSPTDLLASSLGLCMITIMGIAARNSGFNIDGTKARVTKIMASDPRRVGEVIVELDFPAINYTEREKQIIRQCAKICPVSQSLHPDLKQTVIFNFQ